MEILVLGAGGMAGHVASIYLQEKGHNITGFAKNPLSYCDYILGDALERDVVKSAITAKPFDAVINCIGVLNKDVDNHVSDGIYLNSYFPHFIVDCLQNTKTKFIHLSTDCVFSGKSGQYNEKSFKDSDSLYGLSKSLGEINDTKNLTFRTSIVGPDQKANGIGLLNWFVKQNKAVSGYTKAIWTGVSTITLAKAIEQALVENLCGVYHLVNNESISKYDLLLLFNTYIKEKKVDILSDHSVQVDKSLVNTRSDFGFPVPSYEQMVIEMNEWINTHKELYPHYF